VVADNFIASGRNLYSMVEIREFAELGILTDDLRYFNRWEITGKNALCKKEIEG